MNDQFMGKTQQTFFLLLRNALGNNEPLPTTLTDREWHEVWNMSYKQALIGVVFDGICKLPKDQSPNKQFILKWFSVVRQIEQSNRKLNHATVKTTEQFAKEGFKSVILKGQGNSVLYPEPLHRTPGDIDIWVDGGRDRIMKYVRNYFPNAGARYHHVDFPILNGIEVEVHFTPSWLSQWHDNMILQRWFKERAKEQYTHFVNLPEDAGSIAVPTNDFNRIFLLLHIYRHFFDEGIGIRQLVDYVLLLRQGFTEKEREETVSMLSKLHMIRFTSAIMYILKLIFKLEDKYMLIEPNKEQGEFVLNEIIRTGNFGYYNKNISNKADKAFKYYYSKWKYKFRFIKLYPRETLWGNIFWVWQYFWRIYKGYKK